MSDHDAASASQQPTPQPEYVWAFPPERQRHPGRVWLIVLLSIVAVAIVGVVLWFTAFAAPSAAPSPTPTTSSSGTPSASPTASASASASPLPSDTPSASATPLPTPQETVSEAPAPVDPEIPVFRDQVQPRLGEASTGLDILSTTNGPDASMIVADLRADALRLVETTAPSSISSAWQGSLDGYLGALDALDAAISSGSDLNAAIDNARGEVAILNDLLS